jgi:hypothetical protein
MAVSDTDAPTGPFFSTPHSYGYVPEAGNTFVPSAPKLNRLADRAPHCRPLSFRSATELRYVQPLH